MAKSAPSARSSTPTSSATSASRCHRSPSAAARTADRLRRAPAAGHPGRMSQTDPPRSETASGPGSEAQIALVLVHADPDRRDLDGFAGVVGDALQDRGWELRTRTAVAPVPAEDLDAADLVV